MSKLGKTIRHRLGTGIALLAAAIMVFSTGSVQAATARQYDVAFRAGSQGTVSGTSSRTFRLDYGTTMDESYYRGLVSPNSGYYFTGWSPDFSATVSGQAVYVAQYARILEEVSYRVDYVNEQGTLLATSEAGTTQLGSVLSRNAIAIDGYAPVTASQSITTVSGLNVITFTYTSTAVPTTVVVTETSILYVPAATTVTATTAPAAATTAPGAATTAPGTETTTTPTGQTTVIGDNTVPLAPSADASSSASTEEITDTSVPLGMQPSSASSASSQIFGPATIIGIGAVLIVLIALLLAKRKKKKA